MTQEMLTFPGMQSDHRQWDHVHSTWRADVERWQREHESALSQLATLEEMIRQHGEALESHAQAIEHHQQGLRDHGREMAEFQNPDGGEPVQNAMASKHQELAGKHRTQHEAHERIKKHHHTVMAHLTMLEKAVEAAM